MGYSWSEFGREAEYIVALYLKSVGWREVRLSPGSRGPADVIASYQDASWFIQVKASRGLPRLNARDFRRLKKLAVEENGLGVVATLQPLGAGVFSTGNFDLNFYEIGSWSALDPAQFLEDSNSISSSPKVPWGL